MSLPRNWFVTGASRGLGRAIVQTALDHGDRVVAAARSVDGLAALQAPLGRLVRVSADVTDPHSVQRAVAQAVEAFGRIDVVVNNAGRHLRGAVEEVSDVEARAVFDVNFFGVLTVLREVLPVLRSQRSGSLITIGSMSGYSANAGAGLYAATKFALEGLGQAIAPELAEFGLQYTTVEPGSIRTDFLSHTSRVNARRRIDSYQSGPAGDAHLAALARADGRQPGDPRRAAEVIYAVAASDRAPLHLPLGADAYAAWESRTGARRNEMTEWQTLATEIDLGPEPC